MGSGMRDMYTNPFIQFKKCVGNCWIEQFEVNVLYMYTCYMKNVTLNVMNYA